jgi:hypothetical protein
LGTEQSPFRRKSPEHQHRCSSPERDLRVPGWTCQEGQGWKVEPRTRPSGPGMDLAGRPGLESRAPNETFESREGLGRKARSERNLRVPDESTFQELERRVRRRGKAAPGRRETSLARRGGCRAAAKRIGSRESEPETLAGVRGRPNRGETPQSQPWDRDSSRDLGGSKASRRDEPRTGLEPEEWLRKTKADGLASDKTLGPCSKRVLEAEEDRGVPPTSSQPKAFRPCLPGPNGGRISARQSDRRRGWTRCGPGGPEGGCETSGAQVDPRPLWHRPMDDLLGGYPEGPNPGGSSRQWFTAARMYPNGEEMCPRVQRTSTAMVGARAGSDALRSRRYRIEASSEAGGSHAGLGGFKAASFVKTIGDSRRFGQLGGLCQAVVRSWRYCPSWGLGLAFGTDQETKRNKTRCRGSTARQRSEKKVRYLASQR